MSQTPSFTGECAPSSNPDDGRSMYGPACYGLDPRVLAELRELRPYKPVVAAFINWMLICAVCRGFLFLNCWFLYPLVAFLMAGRAGVLLQLAHEASHGLITHDWFNDWFGNWIATYPIGLDLDGYKSTHIRHHACTNQDCEPVSDAEKYRETNIRTPHLWFLFAKDLFGVSALAVRLMYANPNANLHASDDREESAHGRTGAKTSGLNSLRRCGGIGLTQLIILGALFQFNVVHYFLLWIMPLVTAHMFLMRVRGIAEHGLGNQLGITDMNQKTRGVFYTRSLGTPENQYSFRPFCWLERVLIGSLHVNYHHEHHLYPKVPYYNLPKLHVLIRDEVRRRNADVYAKGYFACLFFGHRPHVERAITGSQLALDEYVRESEERRRSA